MALTIEQILTQLSTAAPNMQVVIVDVRHGVYFVDFDVYPYNGGTAIYGFDTAHPITVNYFVKMLEYNPSASNEFPVNNQTDILYFFNESDTTIGYEFTDVILKNNKIILTVYPSSPAR